MVDRNLEKLVKNILLIVPNLSCFVAGSIHGAFAEQGMPINLSYLPYFGGANIISTGISKTLLTTENDSDTKNAVKGALLGAITAPIDYTLGYTLGYGVSFLGNRLFNS